MWNPSSQTGFLAVPIGSGVLDATSTVQGSFSYTATPSGGAATSITSTSVLAVGSYTLTANFTPMNTTVYTSASATVAFTVVKQSIFVGNSTGSVISYLENGTAQSNAVSGGGIGAAVDSSGNVWSIDTNNSGTPTGGVSVFNDAGALTTDLSLGLVGPGGLAIDGNSIGWVASSGTVTALNASGTVTNKVTDSSISGPTGVAVDLSGNVWVANQTTNTVTEVIGAAAPAAPLATAVQNQTPGVKP